MNIHFADWFNKHIFLESLVWVLVTRPEPDEMFGCNGGKGIYVPSYCDTSCDMGSPLDPDNRNM